MLDWVGARLGVVVVVVVGRGVVVVLGVVVVGGRVVVIVVAILIGAEVGLSNQKCSIFRFRLKFKSKF